MQNKNSTDAVERKEIKKNPRAAAASWKGLSQLAGGLLTCLAFCLGVSSSVIAHEGHDHGNAGDELQIDDHDHDHANDIVIPAGITGAWFNPDRDGEGFFLEVVNANGNRVFVVAWYTYEEGEQMWLLGSAPLDPEVRWVEVPMERFSGGRPGIDPGEFNSNTVERADWGTLEFSFSSCNQGTVHYEEATFGFSGSIDLTRLTLIDALGCDGPSEPQSQ